MCLVIAQQSEVDICLSGYRGGVGRPEELFLTEQQNFTLELLSKCGMDGCRSHALYVIWVSEEAYEYVSECDMMTTCICPLRLTVMGKDKITWQNASSSSPVYCHPLRLQFKKENADLVKSGWAAVKADIEFLLPSALKNITVHHKLILTMVDVKVCQALTNTPSTATCYICKPKTNPSEMNNLNIHKKSVVTENLTFGLSPVHLLIRCIECLLNIAYCLKIKTWTVNVRHNNKSMQMEKKKDTKRAKI